MTRKSIVLIMGTHQKGSPDSGEGACIRMQGNTSTGTQEGIAGLGMLGFRVSKSRSLQIRLTAQAHAA